MNLKRYLEAKRAYYMGTPIMDDSEFDRLEAKLKSDGILEKVVGFNDDDRNAKFPHPSKMLSLAKYQASADGSLPTESATKWMKKLSVSEFEATPKFDGNAINIVYRNGKLSSILSRGNGTAGRDYTDKLEMIVPHEISTVIDIIEIRGEVVMPTEIFLNKYAQYKNERNFVAGILNRDEDVSNITKEFVFMAVEIRCQNKSREMGYLPIDTLLGWGFNKLIPLYILKFSSDEFENVYRKMVSYRINDCPVRLDGFVIKTPENTRKEIGENSHDPNWAVAIKFPPEDAITEVIDIQWNFGKTGEMVPVAIMNPTFLDGTTVRRAAVHNLGWVQKNGCYPGATVTIAKKGDIIPQIIKVNIPSEFPYTIPTNCPHCTEKLHLDETHLQCKNDACSGKLYKNFQIGFARLGIDGASGAIAKKLWNAGFKTPFDILDSELFTKDNLIKSGEFKKGKTLDNLYSGVKGITEISLAKIILFFGIDDLGGSTAKEIAKAYAGIDYSYHGLQKSIVNMFSPGSETFSKLDDIIIKLNENNVKIVYPSAPKMGIKFELTGSPKTFGFKTKADFIKYAEDKGYIHAKLNESKILICDNKNGNSSKIKKAKAKGMTIIDYSEI